MHRNAVYFLVIFDLEPYYLALLQLWFKALKQAEQSLK